MMKKRKTKPASNSTESMVALLLDEVTSVKRRTDSLEEIVGFMADADDRLKAKNMGKFGTRRRRAQVYLAVNGIRDAIAIARIVKTQRQNVDAEIRALKKGRLIDIADNNGHGVIYRKKGIDRITGLSDDLMEAFQLDPNGRAAK